MSEDEEPTVVIAASHYREMKDDVQVMVEERRLLLADRARLDWLERQFLDVWPDVSSSDAIFSSQPGVDLRTKIDAEMAKAPSGAARPADLAPPDPNQDWLLRYAQDLATYAAKKLGCVPEWRPLDDLPGVLTQIDNCLAGLVAPASEPQAPEAQADV